VIESRRPFIRRAKSIAIGAGILLVADGLTKVTFLTQDERNPGTSSTVKNHSRNSRVSLLTVKVYYSMMTQYAGMIEEYFVLQSPAIVRDLLNTVVLRHPSMAQMAPTMLILFNGIPAKPGASLRDGDELQFIPLYAGG
jgi:hypothetical protein